MKENDKFHLDEIKGLMEQDRQKLVITSLENLNLIKEDDDVSQIIKNQKRLHDIAYEMYEIQKENKDINMLLLLMENLTIIEINTNLMELFILLKGLKDTSKDLVIATMKQELNLTSQNSLEDICTYLMDNSNSDVEKSEQNYQKVLKMKGEKNE